MARFKKEVSLSDDGLVYRLPKLPDEKLIAGYEISSKKQKFQKQNFLTDDEFKKLRRESQLEIITTELTRRVEGYWFFNNGVPTYITGSHYFYLNYWYMAAITPDGMPDYRYAQTKWAYFVDLCEKDNLCFGAIMLSAKRFSKTEFALAHIYNLATLIENDCLFGLQSLNATEAKNNLFVGRIIRSHRRIPDYLKPTSNDSKGRKEITSKLTFIGEKDGSKYQGGLNNVIDHRPTLPSAYQGKRPRGVYIDEPGTIEEMDIIEALSTIKQQLQIGKRAFGKIFLPATLESMTPKGAPMFFQIWNESDPSMRDANGRTQSWLYRYFNPQYEGREDFIDEYGNSKIDEAKSFRKNELDFATASGQMKIKRQYPETVDEAFGSSAGGLCWEDDVVEILKQQKTAILNADVPLGKFSIVNLNGAITANPNQQGKVWMLEPPKQGCIYVHLADGVATDTDTGGIEGSNIAGVVVKVFDPNSDPYMPVLLYSERPKTIEGAYYNLLNQGLYYNQFGGFEKFYAEANASHASHFGNFLISRGHKELIAMRKDLSGKGWTDQKKMFQYRTPELIDFQHKQGNMFLRKYAHSIQMLPLIEQLLMPKSVNCDLRDAWLQFFTARPNFDEAPKPKKPPRKITTTTLVMRGGVTYYETKTV